MKNCNHHNQADSPIEWMRDEHGHVLNTSATHLSNGGAWLGFALVCAGSLLGVWPLAWAVRKIPGVDQVM